MATRTPPQASADVVHRVQDAKAPITVVAGPYGHPFHPLLVTVPIGAWVSSLVFDIASRARDGGAPTLVDASHWLLLIGVIGAVVAALFGLMDLITIPSHTTAFRTGLLHMALNLSVVGLFLANFIWRHVEEPKRTEVTVGQLVLTIVALVVLAVSGWLGGRLSYRFGVRVADENTQAEGFR